MQLQILDVSILHPDALALMAALSRKLETIVGDPGRNSFADWVEGDARHVFIVAYEDGVPVGCGGLRPLGDGVGEIKRMYAARPGAGIGAAVLAHLEGVARAAGYAHVRLETRAVNTAALGFYLARGYRRIENYGRYVGRVEAVCFGKILTERDGMPQSFELRAARETDYEAIAAIWHSSASLPDVGPAVMPSVAALRERLDVEFAAGWSVTLAVRGNDTIGFVGTRVSEGILAELFVRPGSLGGGVGRALIAHAKGEMAGGFTLYTRSANLRARRFYEREGLVVAGEGPHPRTGDPITYFRWGLA